MKTHQILCDECGIILEGMEKGKYVQHSYIQFKGRMAMEIYNSEMERREYFFLTPRENEEMALCDTKCFQSLIDRKHEEHTNRMQSRQRAGEDPYGLDFGGSVTGKPFIVGSKKLTK